MNFLEAYSWINIRFLLSGLWLTIQVAGITIILSVIIGILLGIVRYYEIPYLSKVIGFVIDTIRNLPLLLIIFFTYLSLPQIGIQFNIFWSAVVAMTIFESSMISEIIRGGFVSLPKGQTESGLASGLTKNQTLFYILLPQALKQTLPSIVSQLIALIKDTSLATIIALPELTHRAKIIYGQDTSFVIPMFAALAFLYFIICYSLSKFSRYLTNRISIL